MQVVNYNNQDINNLIMQSISKLDSFQQIKLFEFITSLIDKKETNTENLIRFAGSINKKDIAIIKSSIEDGCEKIDSNEW